MSRYIEHSKIYQQIIKRSPFLNKKKIISLAKRELRPTMQKNKPNETDLEVTLH